MAVVDGDRRWGPGRGRVERELRPSGIDSRALARRWARRDRGAGLDRDRGWSSWRGGGGRHRGWGARRDRVERHLPPVEVDRGAQGRRRARHPRQLVAVVDRYWGWGAWRGRVERQLRAGAVNGDALARRRARHPREAVAAV